MDTKSYDNIAVEHKENSLIEIRGEITTAAALRYRNEVIKELSQTVEVSGFRKGHAPEHILIQKLGESFILERVAQRALEQAFGEILKEQHIDAVGEPHITITKLAPNNPIGFTITTAIYPKIVLPDYKEITQNVLQKQLHNEISVSDKELDEAIFNIRKTTVKDGGGNSKVEENPPELTEELVKSWRFENIEDFKSKLRNDLQREKERREKEKSRIAIVDAIIEKSTIPLPELFVTTEQNKMIAEFKGNIERMGLSYNEYLGRIGKTEEEIKKEWREQAQKRAKMQLVLHGIAKRENIKPDTEKVEEQTKHIFEHHKDANPDAVHTYVTGLLTREAVFEFLETIYKPS